MPATPRADWALEPWATDAQHRLVPKYRDASPIDPNIGRLSAELAPFFAPLELCRCAFGDRAALQQHPNIEARVGLYEEVGRKVVGVSAIVEQSEGTNHRGEIKTRGWLQGSGDNGEGCP
jgi:hypothetical protein